MRTVKIRDVTIGDAPKICMPLVGKTDAEVLLAADEALVLSPDMVEFRADYYQNISDIEALAVLLGKIRSALPKTPILFTCRDESEGGAVGLGTRERANVIESALRSGLIDALDIELAFADELSGLIATAKSRGAAVILSAHFFSHTPARNDIIAILLREQALGADIAKVAVTPQSPTDVLELLYASARACELADIPIIAISMGKLGLVSRVAGGVFGSAVTFGAGGRVSAPGQISVGELRAAMELYH